MTQRERVQEYHRLIWDSVVCGRRDILTLLEQFAQQIRQETLEEVKQYAGAQADDYAKSQDFEAMAAYEAMESWCLEAICQLEA